MKITKRSVAKLTGLTKVVRFNEKFSNNKKMASFEKLSIGQSGNNKIKGGTLTSDLQGL